MRRGRPAFRPSDTAHLPAAASGRAQAAAGAAATQAAEEGSDAEIIRYMLQTILKESKQKDWLINRIKNDPRKMAALIADGVEKALSDADKPATEAE